MKPIKKQTLVGITEEMASFPWSDTEIEELMQPKMGMISGLQDLLRDLEVVRRIDLGAVAIAQGVKVRKDRP